jgi:hypothetical protein
MAMRRPESIAYNSRAGSGAWRMAPATPGGGVGARPEMPRAGTLAPRPALDAERNTGIVLRGEVGVGDGAAARVPPASVAR